MSKCSHKIQPLILLFKGEKPKAEYLEAFSDEKEFFKPRLYHMKQAPQCMVERLGCAEAMIKYNNLSILEECSEKRIPYFILYNCTRHRDNLDLISKLVYQSSELREDFIFFSENKKPCEPCEMSATVKCIDGKETEEMRRFNLYRLYSCTNTCSYLVNPCGAKKLLSYYHVKKEEGCFVTLVTSVLETSSARGLYFFPSLFCLEDEEQGRCLEESGAWSYWWLMMIFIIILLLLASVFIYFRYYRKDKKKKIQYKIPSCEKSVVEEKRCFKPTLEVPKRECKMPSSIMKSD